MDILEILPAVRMSASKNGLVTCRLTDEKGDVSGTTAKTLVIEKPEEIRDSFGEWFENNADTPETVVVKDVCTIGVSSPGETGRQRIPGRVVIVTGGAQGFGAGIAEELFEEGANIVVADLNEEVGGEMVGRLNAKDYANKGLFVKCVFELNNLTDNCTVEQCK